MTLWHEIIQIAGLMSITLSVAELHKISNFHCLSLKNQIQVDTMIIMYPFGLQLDGCIIYVMSLLERGT